MIDTDKYEGHSPGPWEEGEYTPSDEMIERFQNRELQGAVMQQSSNIMLAMIGLDGNGEKDRLLMADAPLLFEEVKRLDKLCWDIEIDNQKLNAENGDLKAQVNYYCIDLNTLENMNVDLKAEVKKLREENHTLEMMAWEYERVWEWLMENADYTCRKLLLLIEEWKEEDGLVTIDGVTYEKEMIE